MSPPNIHPFASTYKEAARLHLKMAALNLKAAPVNIWIAIRLYWHIFQEWRKA